MSKETVSDVGLFFITELTSLSLSRRAAKIQTSLRLRRFVENKSHFYVLSWISGN